MQRNRALLTFLLRERDAFFSFEKKERHMREKKGAEWFGIDENGNIPLKKEGRILFVLLF